MNKGRNGRIKKKKRKEGMRKGIKKDTGEEKVTNGIKK